MKVVYTTKAKISMRRSKFEKDKIPTKKVFKAEFKVMENEIIGSQLQITFRGFF